MKILKYTVCTLLAVALAVTLAASCYTSYRQNTGGSYSGLTTVTGQSQQWILGCFGHCESVSQLLDEILTFGCENFVYELQPYGILQDFSMDEFLFEDLCHGVCFDFSAFAKCVVTVWAEAKGRDDVEAYVYDVILSNGGRHSYNYFSEDGRKYFLCMTTNVERTRKGKPLEGVVVLEETMEEWMDRWGDKLMVIH